MSETFVIDYSQIPKPREPGIPSEKDMQALKLFAAGLGSKEIAPQMHIGRGTVDTHIARAVEKVGAKSRLHAVLTLMEGQEIPVEVLPEETIRTVKGLSATDQEVLDAMIQGNGAASSSRELSQRLGISKDALGRRIGRILEVLHVYSAERAAIVYWTARRDGRYDSIEIPSETKKALLLSGQQILLERIAHGETLTEIAQSEGVSENTLSHRARRAYRRLEAKNSLHAVLRALELGEIPMFVEEDDRSNAAIFTSGQRDLLERLIANVSQYDYTAATWREMGISKETYDRYMDEIVQSLGAKNRDHAVYLYFQTRNTKNITDPGS